jgi:hypothetical protein
VLTPSDTTAHLYRTQMSGSDERFRLVIRDQASYHDLIGKLRQVVDRDAGVDVDFSRSEVIAVSFGPIGGAGPVISIDSVIDTARERRIVVRRIWQAAGCTEGAAVTNPIDIVIVPASPASTTIRWDERESSRGDCGDPQWTIQRRRPHS